MEPVSNILLVSLGYILKGAAQSKTAEKAKEEILNAFWQWIRPRFIKDIPEIEEASESLKIKNKAHSKLLELVKDESFFRELVKKVDSLQKAGIKEKNIAIGNIIRVKKIRIGDKVYSPDDQFNRKNIIEGNVEDADEFHLGDG